MADEGNQERPDQPAISAQEVTPRIHEQTEDEASRSLGGKLATVALVGVGAALIEVELIPGMLLGVAAVLMPDVLPKLGRALRPVVKSTIRAGYSVVERTREVVEEAREEVEDMVAEARAEQQHPEEAARRPEGAPSGSPA